MQKKKILVVDYEPRALEKLVSMIPQDEYEVFTAKDGTTALEEFEKVKPDLVLLRTMLPKKHGFQVCQEMVEKDKSIPVVMHCSIYKSRKYKNDAIQIYGAKDYLEDPIDQNTLLQTLKKYLGEKEESKKEETLPLSTEVKQEQKKKGGLDIDKALEETLSGLTVPVKKKEAQKVEIKLEEKLVEKIEDKDAEKVEIKEEEIKEEKVIEAQKEQPKESEKVELEAPLTSEELFGDVIKTVEEKIVKPKLEEKVVTPKIDIESALGKEEVQEAKKEEVKKEEKIKEPIKKIELTPIEELKVKEKPKITPKIDVSDLDKKLEETLSGVKLKPKKEAEPKKVEVEKEPLKEEVKEKIEKEEIKEEKIPVEEKVVPIKKEKIEIKEEKAKEEEEKKVEKPKEEGIPFGNYRLLEKIAVGGMAELFKAKQMGLEGFQRIVAVKRILPHLATNSDFVTMFIDEAKLAAQLSHPNIVHIYDLGKADDSYFIAMEYIEGKDLRAIMKETEMLGKKVPLSAAIYIAKKVCSALHYAHSAKDSEGKPMKLVHRDVSPQNILISSTGEVKLVDFGIAKAASKASHTQSGALKGKLLYMSPEQAWGKTLDGRSDIFSLGSVLFEMLTGRKLFYGDSEMSILERVREAKLPDFEEFRNEIPPGLEKIIKRALEKDPDRRFRDARSMEAELDKFARNYGITATAYDVVQFLSEIFPTIYTKDKLDVLIREKEEAEAEIAQFKKQQEKAKEVKEEEKKVVEFPAPSKEEKAEGVAQPKRFTIPKPEKVEEKVEEKKGEKVFTTFAEEEEEAKDKKKPLIVGGIVAGVVALIIVIFLLFGGKKGSTQLEVKEEPKSGVQEEPTQMVTKTEPTVPKEIVPQVPQPPTQAEPEEEVKKAREEATNTFKSFIEILATLESEGAKEYASEALDSLKKTQGNIDRILRRAKSIGEFNAVSQSAKQAIENANKLRSEIAQIKQQKEKELEEARRRQEEEKKKAEELAKQAQAQTQEKKIERGSFVPLPELEEGERPKLLKKIDAVYTSLARQNKVEGTFYVQMTVDENGKVINAEVLRGPSPDYGLKEECIKAALKWEFSPAIKNGVPVKTSVTYPFVFKIK